MCLYESRRVASADDSQCDERLGAAGGGQSAVRQPHQRRHQPRGRLGGRGGGHEAEEVFIGDFVVCEYAGMEGGSETSNAIK